MAKKTDSLGRWRLFFASTALLCAAALMKVFPILSFVALAPLFALADDRSGKKLFWENADLILVTLSAGFFTYVLFHPALLPETLLLAIVYTMPFIGFALVRNSLGPFTSHFTVAIFWLALEYLILKTGLGQQGIFLADFLNLKIEWLRWNIHTGYLGASLWILLINAFVYQALLTGSIKWIPLVLAFILASLPLWPLSDEVTAQITRDQMLSFYSGCPSNGSYDDKGEWVARTATWVSVLIILVSLVRSRTKGKKPA